MSRYIYTIFDANPHASSGGEWPTHDRVAIEADSDEQAIDKVAAVMSIESAGLSADGDYAAGDKLYALVWDADGIIVGEPTYDIPADDLA